jgi:chromosome segregation ATPase
VQVSAADRAAQQAFVAEVGAALERLSDASNQAQGLADQLDERGEAIAHRPGAAELRTAVDTLVSRLDSLADVMYSPHSQVTYDILAKGSRLYSRLTPLYNWASEGDGAPTQGMKQVWAEQKRELQGYLDRYQQLLDVDLAHVNALAARLGVPWVVVKEKPKVIS